MSRSVHSIQGTAARDNQSREAAISFPRFFLITVERRKTLRGLDRLPDIRPIPDSLRSECTAAAGKCWALGSFAMNGSRATCAPARRGAARVLEYLRATLCRSGNVCRSQRAKTATRVSHLLQVVPGAATVATSSRRPMHRTWDRLRPMRALGLDVGSKTIGIAVSDSWAWRLTRGGTHASRHHRRRGVGGQADRGVPGAGPW